MHIDFCFVDRAGRGLVAGWSPDSNLTMWVMIGGQRLPVTMFSRFPRRDLGTRQEQGVMASFRLGNPSILDDIELLELSIIINGELKNLAAERLTQDEEQLIVTGVDELFTAYLRAIAAGAYGRPPREITRSILNRIQGNLRMLPAETPGIAVNLDRLLVSPSGLGVFTGWCMTDQARPGALTALVSGGQTLNPAKIILNSIKREDLAVYRDRYRYTGTNGFCGTFRLPMTADRDARMVLLSNVANSDFVFGREAELVSDEEAATALCELRAGLSDPRIVEALTAAAAPRRPLEPFAAPCFEPLGADARIAVMLEVDVAPVELRDVLRLLHVNLKGDFTVHLLGRHDGEISRPMKAALGEAGGEIQLGEPLTTAQLLSYDFGRAWVIYGRASTFFQMQLPSIDATASACVTYHDPAGALPGRAIQPSWPGHLNPPFLLATPAPVLSACLHAVPRGFVTPEGIMRAVVDLLHERGLVSAQRGGSPTWFPSTEMQSHPEYDIARALDTEMRALVDHEERT